MFEDFKQLNNEIIKCNRCPRLVEFRSKVAREKRKQYLSQEYWGKAVTGFGDIKGQLLILGLAPAAHGANRTGRVFTGDRSAEFLFKCLKKAQISNNSKSENKYDGLVLKNTYITLALKCLPPNDKPTKNELNECSKFLKNELFLLNNIKVILTLGQIAFDSCLKFFDLPKKDFKFKHGAIYNIKNQMKMVSSYHPSPRNVNTGKIDEKKMTCLLKHISRSLKPHQKNDDVVL